MMGRAYFSHKELDRVSSNGIKDMLVNNVGKNWNDVPTVFKRGSCVMSSYVNERLTFEYDNEIPIFSEKPEYVNNHLKFSV
jgi:tRNA(His) 5'-end guanylyltransferase